MNVYHCSAERRYYNGLSQGCHTLLISPQTSVKTTPSFIRLIDFNSHSRSAINKTKNKNYNLSSSLLSECQCLAKFLIMSVCK